MSSAPAHDMSASSARTEAASGTAPDPPRTQRQLTDAEINDAVQLLSGGVMFRRCGLDDLHCLARAMHACVFAQGEELVTQGERSTSFWTVAEGEILRLRRDANGTTHHVDAAACGTTVNSLQILPGDPVFATARCVSEVCRAYGIDRQSFATHLTKHPQLAFSIIASLSYDVRRKSKLFRTPLLQQQTTSINYSSVTIAAAIESYYRSALNAALNRRLSGVKSPLFPSMHIQVPARVLYINGFKGLRAFLDREIHTETYSNPNLVRLAVMLGPGLLMTPVASFLEACNAGHANPEPFMRRSLRGMLPRSAREVIFGIGINPLSDYFEERYRTMAPNLQISSNPLVANMTGSVTAGVIAGYLSHVPHNVSTYKLLEPHSSYRQLFAKFVDKSVPNYLIPRGIPELLLPATRIIFACLFPRGVIIRTIQIVGSFAILNGTIQYLNNIDDRRLGRVLASYTGGSDTEGST